MWDESHGWLPHVAHDHIPQRCNRQQESFFYFTPMGSSITMKKCMVFDMIEKADQKEEWGTN
jgi:hypothetical protein